MADQKARDGVSIALASHRYLFEHRGWLMLLFGPAFALLFAQDVAVLSWIATWQALPRPVAIAGFLASLALSLVWIAATLAAVLALCRFMLAGAPPRLLARPFKPILAATWRLILALFMFSVFDEVVIFWLDGQMAGWAGPCKLAIEVVVFLMLSPHALVLPALAIGEPPEKATSRALHLGSSFQVGVAMVVAPFLALAVGLDRIDLGDGASLSALSLALALAYGVLIFLGVATLAVYLAKVYRLGPVYAPAGF